MGSGNSAFVLDCVSQLVTAGANGSVKLWDTTARDAFPIASFDAHSEDVAAVDWSITRKDCFVTGGWDRAVHVRAVFCSLLAVV